MKKSLELKQELAGLKEERNGKLDSIQALNTKAETEKRSLTEDEQKDVDAKFAEVEELEKRFSQFEKDIAQAEKLEARAAEAAKENKNNGPANLSTSKDGEKTEKRDLLKKFEMRDAFMYLTKDKGLSGAAAELHQEAENEMRYSDKMALKGFGFPSWAVAVESRTDIDQNTSGIQGTEVGAYVQALREGSIFTNVGATIYNGLTSDFKIPIVGKHSVAWATAENSAATDVGVNFGKDTLAPIRMTGYVDISKRLILQNGAGVTSQVMGELGRASGSLIDAALFSSSDVSNAIPSIAGTSNVGTFTETASFADTTSVMKDLTLAEQTLADAEGLTGRLAYVLSTKLLNQIKRAPQVSNVSPAANAWNFGFTNANGYPTWFSIHPSSATTAADGIFGDFSKLHIGFFGGLDMMVDEYSAALNYQTRLILHRHVDSSAIQGAAFVKFSSLFA